MTILPNDLFQSFSGDLLRVVAIEQENGRAWVINVTNTSALPRLYTLNEIQELHPVKPKNALQAPMPSIAAIRRANAAFEAIEPLLKTPDIFVPAKRHALLVARATELGTTTGRLLRSLRRYWQKGMARDALLPNFQNCGARERQATQGRGRKSDLPETATYQMSPGDYRLIEKFVRKTLTSGKLTTKTDAYQRLLEKHYSYVDADGTRFLKPKCERPSFRQFDYAVLSLFSFEQLKRAKVGEAEFEQNHRAKLGYGLEGCLGVGHIYEIDATIADLFLVYSEDRSRIIGKPSLYLIYDRFSRLVVGFYVGIEEPSWLAAMQAICFIAEDKEAICKKYKVPYDPADWPAHGAFPEEFVADRGPEFTSNASSNLSEQLRITVTNLPARRPDRKGTVECGFKLIQRSLADVVPGYEPPENAKKRQGKKYDKDACMTLDEFRSTMLEAIIYHNRKVMRDYPLPLDMLSQGITPSAINIWNANIQERCGALVRYEANRVRSCLLPKGEASVQQQGIFFKGAYYSCPEAIKQGWFVKAGRRQFRVKVSYDMRLADSIYIEDRSAPNGFIEAVLTERSAAYRGMSFDEVAVSQRLLKNAQHVWGDENLQLKSDFHSQVDPIAQRAHQEMKKVVGKKSRTSRRRDIREDRHQERAARRQEEARMSPKPATPASSAEVIALSSSHRARDSLPDIAQPNNLPNAVSELLKKKRIELLNA